MKQKKLMWGGNVHESRFMDNNLIRKEFGT